LIQTNEFLIPGQALPQNRLLAVIGWSKDSDPSMGLQQDMIRPPARWMPSPGPPTTMAPGPPPLRVHPY